MMLCKTVIFLTLSVICVSSQCDQGCQQYRQYTRVKRGKFYSSPPIRFFNIPPMPIPVRGPFSYTPPPFMTDDVPSYPGSRPYKVSKRPPVPTNDGLGDDDITNLVKHLSKQDLDKILEFAQDNQGYNKYKDIYKTNEYTRPYKRESRIVNKGYDNTKYEEPAPYREKPAPYREEPSPYREEPTPYREEPTPYREEPMPYRQTPAPYREEPTAYGQNSAPHRDEPTSYREVPAPYREESKFSNFVTEPSYVKVFTAQESPRPYRFSSRPGPPNAESYSPSLKPNEVGRFPSNQDFDIPHPSQNFPGSSNPSNEQTYVKVIADQEPQRRPPQIDSENYVSYQSIQRPENISPSETISHSPGPADSSVSKNPYFDVSNEEEKLPLPVNMREEDFEISFTNNVPKIVKSESYDVENFGDLPLMDYNSKLHDVSSYHVPHYTVTQPKPSKPFAPSPPVSFPSYGPPSPLLKPSPAAAAIKEPVYERAPSAAVAAEQSDAHLKAVKIWSHKSQGAAYTLHDDGSLTPERSRPKYG